MPLQEKIKRKQDRGLDPCKITKFLVKHLKFAHQAMFDQGSIKYTNIPKD